MVVYVCSYIHSPIFRILGVCDVYLCNVSCFMFSLLCVAVPANITSPPRSTSSPENGRAIFRCKAHGIDLPLVSWGRIRDFDAEFGSERTFTTSEWNIVHN